MWISTIYIQLKVALYEAIWSNPVYSLLSLGLLATETSLKARIDTPASLQYPFSFRLMLKVSICELGLFLLSHVIHPYIKKTLFSVIIPNLRYLLIQTLHISHRDNRLRWYPPLAKGRYGKSDLKWLADLTNISFISWQNFPKSEKPRPQII